MIEQMIPIDEASLIFGKPITQLLQMVELGKIRAAMLNSTLLLSKMDIQSNLPKESRPEYLAVIHLKGIEIGINEAANKYGIEPSTISRWVKKGFIAVIGSNTNIRGGHKKLIDEADVAYCAAIYKQDPGKGKWFRP